MIINSNDFKFDTATNTITSYLGSDKNVVIPSEIEGNPVIIIGMGAFLDCKNLINVVLPNNIFEISRYAFYRCSNLASITIPNNVTVIGGAAFSGCNNLTNVTIPNTVSFIGAFAFYRCSNLTSITIPNNVAFIGTHAFCECNNLTNVIINSKIKLISSRIFYRCIKLKKVTYYGYIGNWNEETCIEKRTIAISYMEDIINGTEFDKEVIEANKEWIKYYTKKLLPFIAESTYAIIYMTKEKLLDLNDIDMLLDLSKDTESRALILNYKRENWSQEELDEIENDKINKLFQLD